MRIGFYIHHTSLKAGGIFTYSVGILKLLIANDSIEKIFLVIDKKQIDYFRYFEENPKVELVIVNRSDILIFIRLALSYFLHNLYTRYNVNDTTGKRFLSLKKISYLINPYKKVMNPSKIDLFHVPLQYSPVYGGNVPIIVTMHDLQEHHFPEYFNTREKRHRLINNLKAASESDHIIVSFNHIKDDLVEFFNIDNQKVSVCPPPFSGDWFIASKFTSEKELSSKYKIKSKFMLYPAATWQHKNHATLLAVLKSLIEQDIEINLICTGNKTTYFPKIQELIESLNLTDFTKFLGIVPEQDLIGLYKMAELVVIPTLYEAGSAPLYEAMKYSIPVISSGVTSLPETMNNPEYLFNPKDEKRISELIIRMIKDDKFREDNISNSKLQMKKLEGVNYFENFFQVYKKIIKS
jgi:glycosyltransferase involved in cell wall biosynthesis